MLYTFISLAILHTEFLFDLDNSLTQRKTIFFEILKNSQFAKFAKVRMKTQFFFLGKLNQNLFFALHSHYTGDTPYRVWFDLENSVTPWKRPFFKIPFSRNSISSVWNTNFFPDKLYQFFALNSHFTDDIAFRVWFWFGQLLVPMKKNYFLNSQRFALREIHKIP